MSNNTNIIQTYIIHTYNILIMVDATIQNNIIKLYNESGYTDKYGLDLWIVITFTIVIILACMYYYILNHLQPIKANWNNEKCNPLYMPFAGVIFDKKGDDLYSFTANNFTECTQTILEKITNYAFMPFYYAMSAISSIFVVIINAIATIREMFDKLRNASSEIISVIFDRIFNITAPIIEMFINIKSVVAKFVGTITSILYTIIASYYTIESFLKLFMKLVTDILWIIVGVIVAMIILSFVPFVGFFIIPILTATSLGMAALLAIMVYIKISLSNTLNIQSSSLPSVPR
jgi:hypothetical protein